MYLYIILFQEEEEGPGKQLTDIAAEAASLQPKGYTLQTTEVSVNALYIEMWVVVFFICLQFITLYCFSTKCSGAYLEL